MGAGEGRCYTPGYTAVTDSADWLLKNAQLLTQFIITTRTGCINWKTYMICHNTDSDKEGLDRPFA